MGKTVLLKKFCEGIYSDCFSSTIGVDFKLKQVDVDGKRTKLQIWDTAGQERFRNVTHTYYKGASGILLLYSVDNEESFKNINTWIKQIDLHSSEDVVKMLVASKSDLEGERKV